jgi:hypothetical protein
MIRSRREPPTKEKNMKRQTFLPLSILFVTALLLSACGASAATSTIDGFGGEGDDAFYAEEEAMEPMSAPAFEADMAEGQRLADEDFGGNAVDGAIVERLVIKNANLSIVVAEPGKSQSEIAAMAEGMGGFVVESNLYQTTTSTGVEVPRAQITVRVPEERLQDALSTIEDMAIRVENRSDSGQDVTAQYTDLQSRLRNLEDAEELLREIMQEAEDTEDILAAFNQLNNITSQIEVLKGQIRYYEESAAMSAISVQLIPSAAEQPISVGGWEPEGEAREAIQALLEALQGLASWLIRFVLYVLPLLLIFGIPAWLIYRGVRRWQVKREG